MDMTRAKAQEKALEALQASAHYDTDGNRNIDRMESFAVVALAWATLAGTLPDTANVAGRDRTLGEATAR